MISTRHRSNMMHEHQSACTVYDWVSGDRFLNNAKPCSCGFRKQEAEERARFQFRALKPLGMSEENFLRTLGIKPEDNGV